MQILVGIWLCCNSISLIVERNSKTILCEWLLPNCSIQYILCIYSNSTAFWICEVEWYRKNDWLTDSMCYNVLGIFNSYWTCTHISNVIYMEKGVSALSCMVLKWFRLLFCYIINVCADSVIVIVLAKWKCFQFLTANHISYPLLFLYKPPKCSK